MVKLAADFGSVPVLPCDVTHDDQIAALFDALEREWGGLDGLLHSIAFAPREALAGDFLNAHVARRRSPSRTTSRARTALPRWPRVRGR